MGGMVGDSLRPLTSEACEITSALFYHILHVTPSCVCIYIICSNLFISSAPTCHATLMNPHIHGKHLTKYGPKFCFLHCLNQIANVIHVGHLHFELASNRPCAAMPRGFSSSISIPRIIFTPLCYIRSFFMHQCNLLQGCV